VMRDARRPEGRVRRKRPRAPPEETLAAAVECTICMETVKAGRVVRKLSCPHRFHNRCLDHWIQRGGETCPNCRAMLDEE
jgi:hypothetical protein